MDIVRIVFEFLLDIVCIELDNKEIYGYAFCMEIKDAAQAYERIYKKVLKFETNSVNVKI
ncbi:MAG: hypothetical protein HGA22_05845 [Clostridiales bacterium]|nr:hypothetical protein [Clostridiales bacterium]